MWANTHTHMNGWLDESDEGWLEGRSLHSLFLFSFIIWSVSVPPSLVSSTNRHTQSRAGQGLWNQSDSWKSPGRLWVTAPHLYINIVLWRFSSRIHLKIRLFCGTACSVNMFAHTPSLQCCAKVLSQAHSSVSLRTWETCADTDVLILIGLKAGSWYLANQNED